MILNAQNLRNLFVAYDAAFQLGFREAPTDWNKIATEVPSVTAENHYAWLGQMPGLREWIGDRQIKQMASHDYRVKNKKFESTVGVGRDPIEDDTYGVYKPLMQEMGYGAATHPDELVFTLLKNGETELCYDGQPYFDADHPVGREGEGGVVSVSNHGGGSGSPWYLLNTRRALKPLLFQKRRNYDFRSLNRLDDDHVFRTDEFVFGVDARVNAGFGFWQMAYLSKQTLNSANFNAAFAAMQSFKSDEGRPLNSTPSLLVCGPTLRDAALETVKAERNAAGATNVNRNAVDVLVTPWLA
ncbi:Mu-like prophage major head subunit gpT family protein [Algiphilus sp.]|uniref:Mu-like prophage major head subunit gpT family protein n=1 Tax=Algiphilus sp. TaxID=1872431 RepID=UPI0025BBC813|nr:Mu-like prophage major head subunit gpT family protein [Algiphilus sp.]MCK5772040.1 Mu-like prophage major head subunit gpT family protein [Algiphilus sp.]